MRPAYIIGITVVATLSESVIFSLSAAQYIAFSLKVAQQRIEGTGENWRLKEPEVENLAGINHVEGFVYDRETSDLILVGSREVERAPLTLDDLVVALRARLRYKQWPLVSIDPTPDTEKTQMQFVRFEGRIEETVFGKTMFEADYCLKQIGMGLEPPGIGGFKTYWDRSVEETESGAIAGQREVNSRFWFYPINPHVIVREDVCVVRGLKVGVFTEVLAAKVDGKVIDDLRDFNLETADAFANDVSQRFEDLCPAQPSFNRLRGLQELVAISKALEELDERPDLSWWLEVYPLMRIETPKEVKVLRRDYQGRQGLFWVEGGVQLTALALRLESGDVRALREAVLGKRPSLDALKWGFIVTGEWIVDDVDLSKMDLASAAAFFSHGEFLFQQKDYDQAIAYWLQVARAHPELPEVYMKIGAAFERKGMPACAADYYTKALEVSHLLRSTLPSL